MYQIKGDDIVIPFICVIENKIISHYFSNLKVSDFNNFVEDTMCLIG